MSDDLEMQVRKLDLKDGDLLVLTTPLKISREIHDRIHASWSELMQRLGWSVHVVVLTDGADVKVVRPSDGRGG